MAELMYDQFIIGHKHQLNNEDLSSLTLLYLPLLGLDSYAFYFCLTSLNEKELYNYKNVMDILNINSIKTIQNAEDKLQALGLLKVYHNIEKGFLYQIINPLKMQDFLKNSFLCQLLEMKIGQTELIKIKKKHEFSLKGYQEIIKSFDDVFQMDTSNFKQTFSKIIKPSIEIKYNEFNYSLFKMQFDSQFLNDDVLECDDFKKMIIQTSFLYKLNELEMKEIVFKTIKIDKRLDFEALLKYARIIFQAKYHIELPQPSSIKEDQYLNSIQDDETIKLCQYLENVTPAEVLQELSGIKPSIAELKMIDDLINNSKLGLGVVNFMLLYVNAEQDGTLPGYNYFEKIANTWARAKIKTPLDAIRYIEKRQKNKNVNYSKTKTAALPDWYNDYDSSIKNFELKPASEEEVTEILKKAKAMFEE